MLSAVIAKSSPEEEDAIAFVPVCARYPYEVWIATTEEKAKELQAVSVILEEGVQV